MGRKNKAQRQMMKKMQEISSVPTAHNSSMIPCKAEQRGDIPDTSRSLIANQNASKDQPGTRHSIVPASDAGKNRSRPKSTPYGSRSYAQVSTAGYDYEQTKIQEHPTPVPAVQMKPQKTTAVNGMPKPQVKSPLDKGLKLEFDKDALQNITCHGIGTQKEGKPNGLMNDVIEKPKIPQPLKSFSKGQVIAETPIANENGKPNLLVKCSVDRDGRSKIKQSEDDSMRKIYDKKRAHADISVTLVEFLEFLNKCGGTCKLWLETREQTLRKLRGLKKRVHDDQLSFNKTNLVFLGANTAARGLNVMTSNFVSYVGTVVTDVAMLATTSFQALNVDTHWTSFREILEEDAEVTQRFSIMNADLQRKYTKIELRLKHRANNEITREAGNRYSGSTLDKVFSNFLKSIENFCIEGLGKNEKLRKVVKHLFGKGTCSKALLEVWGPISACTSKNPAAKDSCQNAFQTVVDAYCLEKAGTRKLTGLWSGLNKVAQLKLLKDDWGDVRRLSKRVNNEGNESQAVIEDAVGDAIEELQMEFCRKLKAFKILMRQLKSLE